MRWVPRVVWFDTTVRRLPVGSPRTGRAICVLRGSVACGLSRRLGWRFRVGATASRECRIAKEHG